MLNGTAFQAVKFEINAIISNDVLLDYFLQEKSNFMAVDQPILFKNIKKMRPLYRRNIRI